MGYFGQRISWIISQQKLSVGVGLLLLILIVLPEKFVQLFRKRSLPVLFLIGVLNGLLPCGMVYVALAGALATGTEVQGAAFMAFFGAGTVPLMLTIALSAQWMKQTWRAKFLKAAPIFTVVLALLLVARGLNLGIPMISPELEKTPTAQVKLDCCHKK